jgi:8-oxo-dGTP diphosphatase
MASASAVNSTWAGAIDVAAAVILRSSGEFLLARRPAGKVYAGYWEFPGGKVDHGESVAEALKRELHEELGIEVIASYPWLTRVYIYPHATVRLHFRRVLTWRGDPHGREGQTLAWQSAQAPAVEPMLPANAPILKALALPSIYAITHASELGTDAMLQRLRVGLQRGLRLVQVRENDLPREARRLFANDCLRLAREFGARLVINSDVELAREIGADGVHFPAVMLARLDRRPPFDLCGASCHDRDELERAQSFEMDFVVLGPVHATPTHPGAVPLGWEKFGALAKGLALPVYGIGGLTASELPAAWELGAHGVALMRGAWA